MICSLEEPLLQRPVFENFCAFEFDSLVLDFNLGWKLIEPISYTPTCVGLFVRAVWTCAPHVGLVCKMHAGTRF